MSKILDGQKLSAELSLKLTKKIKKLGIQPKLVIIQIGDLQESNSYIKKKLAFAKKIGALAVHKKYPKSVSEREVIADIRKYNADKSVHGIMVQLPIPAKLDSYKIIEAINPKKDVDGLTGKSFVPATTQGILTLLKAYKIAIRGKRVVIVGGSELVGRPTARAFASGKAIVAICDDKDKNLAAETKNAEILIVAAGKPGLISGSHVSKNQVVVDVGITVTPRKKVVGDVDYKKVKNIVRAITPVPGGVGPMTVYSLFENLLKASA